MKTYQIESVINENGIIILPDEMKKLQKHRVKLTIVDWQGRCRYCLDFCNQPHQHLNF